MPFIVTKFQRALLVIMFNIHVWRTGSNKVRLKLNNLALHVCKEHVFRPLIKHTIKSQKQKNTYYQLKTVGYLCLFSLVHSLR